MQGREHSVGNDAASQQIALEQQQVDLLYTRLDEVRSSVERRLRQAEREPTTGTEASITEREGFVSLHRQRLSVLNGVDDRLCFGRLDMLDSATRYVGRIGLFDDSNNPLLMDWRADAAAVFYQATAAQPDGVVRRRHIATAMRKVTGVDDDVLILDALTDATRDTVTGHDSLLTALDAARTGQMRDIVSTIQSEQDRIIRSPLRGILVVQGGPGTGKTVVALHRVAYLLYAHRDRIARSGALIVGPNPGFLRYIDKVLPALGETGVVMSTVGQLYPGVSATETDSPAAARLKGDLRMADVIRNAVRARQRIPEAPIRLRVDNSVVMLTPADVSASIRRARDSRKPYNEARVTYAKDLLGRLAGKLAKSLRINMDDDTRADLIADLRDSKDVRREINLCWMPVSAERLVRDLYADETLLAACGPWLTPADVRALARPAASPWTVSDIAVLDEAAELVGDYDPQAAVRAAEAAQARAAELDYARQVLASSGAAAAMTTAEDLVDRYAPGAAMASLAERAGADRGWAFGHVVVDEAQELSEMDWRMLMRRCPSKSMTIVGDPAQTGSPAGVGNWQEALGRYAEQRWRLERLSINYRTPKLLMDAAADVLRIAGIDADPPNSVREGSWAPQYLQLAGEDAETLHGELAAAIAAERELLKSGTLAVVCAPGRIGNVSQAVDAAIAASALAADAVPVSVCDVADVKGLEFDSVILIEPAEITAASSRPAQDLYVAMTRPTQRLVFVHGKPLPELLRTGGV